MGNQNQELEFTRKFAFAQYFTALAYEKIMRRHSKNLNTCTIEHTLSILVNIMG